MCVTSSGRHSLPSGTFAVSDRIAPEGLALFMPTGTNDGATTFAVMFLRAKTCTLSSESAGTSLSAENKRQGRATSKWNSGGRRPSQ